MNVLHPIKSKRRSIGTQHDITFHSKIFLKKSQQSARKNIPPLNFPQAPTSELA
jgi:hypothetical protein